MGGLAGSVLSGMGSVKTAAPADATPSSGGVTSWNGQTGAVTYAPVIPVATPAALAAVPVLGLLGKGQPAWVEAMRTGAGPGAFRLQTAISSSPDSFFVIPTLDDPLLQWVYSDVQEQGNVYLYSDEINFLVSPQTIVLFPPVNYRYTSGQNPNWTITSRNGTLVTGPTAQIGTDAGTADIVPSTVQAVLVALAANQNSALNGVGSGTPNNLDLSTNGVKLKITSPASGGSATIVKGRLKMSFLTNRFT